MQSRPEKLKDELVNRAQYYAKGFGGCLYSLKDMLHMYAKEGFTDESTVQYIREALQEMLELYSEFDLDEIADHPDYDLLSQIKHGVVNLEQEVDSILQGKSDTEAFYEIFKEIDSAGHAFRDRLNALLEVLRQYPGYESFCFTSTDMHGRLWRQIF